jgi:hypothetical protein
MVEENTKDQMTEIPSSRTLIDRHPVTIAFVVVEAVLLLSAIAFFYIGEPMSPNATTAAVVGGILLIVAITVGVTGGIVLIANSLIKFSIKYRRKNT